MAQGGQRLLPYFNIDRDIPPKSAKGRYSLAECVGAHKETVEGEPDRKRVVTPRTRAPD